MIKCITYCDSSNILLQITVPFGVITNYVEKLLQITAGITNRGVIRNYVTTTTLSLFQLFLLMKRILYLMFHMSSANLYVSFCVSYLSFIKCFWKVLKLLSCRSYRTKKLDDNPQPTITCSKLTKETLEQGVKDVQS